MKRHLIAIAVVGMTFTANAQSSSADSVSTSCIPEVASEKIKTEEAPKAESPSLKTKKHKNRFAFHAKKRNTSRQGNPYGFAPKDLQRKEDSN